VRSERAAEFRTARALHRELEFLLAWPPGAEGAPPAGQKNASAPLRLQGFIDCLVQDASGDWSVVDFKTNHITTAEVPTVAMQYEPQMMLYALAVEEILGQSPKRLTLHFLHPGVEHNFTWNAAARKNTIAQITAALASAASGKAKKL
jgi:ATP-dependent exoDNAse (exonuclease V) beta subunit